jgi:thiamine kinase-like enzyme
VNLTTKINKFLLGEGVSSISLKLLEWQKNKELQKYINKKKWDKAVKVAERLVILFPDNTNYKLRLASCYQKTEKEEMAFSVLNQGNGLNLNLKDLINTIEKNLDCYSLGKSKYLYLGGWQNLGFIEHEIINERYSKLLTKISTMEASKNELLFYSHVINLYPEIKEYTPDIISIQELKSEKLCLITMEKLNGSRPEFSDNLIKKVIEISRVISSMSYNSMEKYITLPAHNSVELTPKRLISSMHFLNYSHEEATNKELFHSLYKYMEELNYSNESINLIKDLELIILGNQMYKYIIKDVHYSVQHGDLSSGNFLYENDNKNLYIIDWGHMRIGPRWIDLAGFLGRYKLSFHNVNKLFLSNLDASKHLDQIERLFFVYTLIIAWFSVLSREEFENSHDSHIRPAINYIQQVGKEVIAKK